MAKRSKTNHPLNDTRPDAGVGASDADNGGGAGSGIPDADLAMNAGDAVVRGDTDSDRNKLFPEAKTHRGEPSAKKKHGAPTDETTAPPAQRQNSSNDKTE